MALWDDRDRQKQDDSLRSEHSLNPSSVGSPFFETITWKRSSQPPLANKSRAVSGGAINWGTSGSVGSNHASSAWLSSNVSADQRDNSSHGGSSSIWADDLSRSSHASYNRSSIQSHVAYEDNDDDITQALQNISLSNIHRLNDMAGRGEAKSSGRLRAGYSEDDDAFLFKSSNHTDGGSIPGLIGASRSSGSNLTSVDGIFPNDILSSSPPLEQQIAESIHHDSFLLSSSPSGRSTTRSPFQNRKSRSINRDDFFDESESSSIHRLLNSPETATEFQPSLEMSLANLSILPEDLSITEAYDEDLWGDFSSATLNASNPPSPRAKKHDWLQRMTQKLQETPEGQLDPAQVPLPAIMNAWAKTKSANGASMVEKMLDRAQVEYELGNRNVVPTAKMYTIAVDAWARSGEGAAAAQRAEAILHRMYDLYRNGNKGLRPTTGIFNAVINAWARSKDKMASSRAEEILVWMENLKDDEVLPDKYTFNTAIHAFAKAGGMDAAKKAQELLTKMQTLYREGNSSVKPDTITYNVVINCWAKSGGKAAATEAESLLSKMHSQYQHGDNDVKPNVVTYGAVIDALAKSGEPNAAARADNLLAEMIKTYQSDPITHADLMPNTYVFNTVINCWAKSRERDAASKAEEMLMAMGRLHTSGMASLKPDAFTYTAVIDAWAKSGYKGAAARADQLLDKMEAKYLAGDADLKPNTFTYNAVINALAKSGEAGAAARAERVLQNMVNRHRNGGGDEVKPTTINFNTILDAWAKSGGGRPAAERAEEILQWMDRLFKQGNTDVKPDTITFNAVIDAWARSGDRAAPRRAEQILDHMDELFRNGNTDVKPDTYTYNTLINAWAKSGERGAAGRAEHILSIMERRFNDGDTTFKPNTRTHTSVIDAWAKSGERGAAKRAEQILNSMISRFESTNDIDVKPNVHTANAVCNACAFSKHEEDRAEALEIAFRVFGWLSSQQDLCPDSYTYTILLSVCSNLLSRDDFDGRYVNASHFFNSCRDTGYVNDYVLRKLRQTVTEEQFYALVGYTPDTSASSLPKAWTRNARVDAPTKGRKHWNNRRRK